MKYCEYCGLTDVEAHSKYTDRCENCGKDYHRYTSYKSQQKNKPTYKRQILLDRIVEDYKLRAQAGYKVPRDIKKD